MWGKRKFFRITALFTALIFLPVNTSWAQIPSPVTLPDRGPAELSSLERFIIPDELGRIESQYHAAPDKPFIVYIQDAHAIWDAQNHIQGLIEYLQEKYGVSLIALEGGKGKLDPTLFRTFPNDLVKKKVLSQYLERGELSGAEMAAVFNPKEATYVGIEDWGLYEENYLAYLQAVQVKEKFLEKLKVLKTQFDQERKKIYSPKLNEFHKHVGAFYEESAHLLELLKYLQSLHAPQETLHENYPLLAVLFESIARDSSMEKESLEVQIRRMAEGFKKKFFRKLPLDKQKEFNRHSQAFLTGAIDSGSFLKVLVETAHSIGVKPKLPPTLQTLLGHVETLSTIKGTKLFDELQSFLSDVETNLIAKSEEKDLAGRYKELRLLKDLANLELTREQWGEYRRNSEPYASLLGEQDKLLNPANEFYRVVFERDQAFHRNLEELLKREKANSAIVLAGGFHAQGFEKSLKETGYSYAVISPKIDSLEGKEVYSKVMEGKLSYKPYLKTTFYDAFVRHSSINLVSELNEPDFKKNLKLWRDEVIRKLANEGRITEANQYTRYIDLLFKTYFDKFGEGKAPASKEEILKAIEQELDSFRDDTVNHLWQRFQIQFKEFTQGLRELIDKKALTKENVFSLLERANQTKPFTLVQLARPALTPGISVQSMRPELRDFILNGQQPKVTSEITPVPFAKPEDVVSALIAKARTEPIPPTEVIDTLSRTESVRTVAEGIIQTGGLIEKVAPEVKPTAVNPETVNQMVANIESKARQELQDLPNSVTPGAVALAIAKAVQQQSSEPRSKSDLQPTGQQLKTEELPIGANDKDLAQNLETSPNQVVAKAIRQNIQNPTENDSSVRSEMRVSQKTAVGGGLLLIAGALGALIVAGIRHGQVPDNFEVNLPNAVQRVPQTDKQMSPQEKQRLIEQARERLKIIAAESKSPLLKRIVELAQEFPVEASNERFSHWNATDRKLFIGGDTFDRIVNQGLSEKDALNAVIASLAHESTHGAVFSAKKKAAENPEGLDPRDTILAGLNRDAEEVLALEVGHFVPEGTILIMTQMGNKLITFEAKLVQEKENALYVLNFAELKGEPGNYRPEVLKLSNKEQINFLDGVMDWPHLEEVREILQDISNQLKEGKEQSRSEVRTMSKETILKELATYKPGDLIQIDYRSSLGGQISSFIEAYQSHEITYGDNLRLHYTPQPNRPAKNDFSFEGVNRHADVGVIIVAVKKISKGQKQSQSGKQEITSLPELTTVKEALAQGLIPKDNWKLAGIEKLKPSQLDHSLWLYDSQKKRIFVMIPLYAVDRIQNQDSREITEDLLRNREDYLNIGESSNFGFQDQQSFEGRTIVYQFQTFPLAPHNAGEGESARDLMRGEVGALMQLFPTAADELYFATRVAVMFDRSGNVSEQKPRSSTAHPPDFYAAFPAMEQWIINQKGKRLDQSSPYTGFPRSEVRTFNRSEIRSVVSKAEAFAKDAREKAAELRNLKWSLSDRTGFLKKPFWEEGEVPLKDRIWASLRAKADRFRTVVSEMEKIQRDSAMLLGEVMQDEGLKDLEKGKVRKSDDDIEEIMNEVEEMRSQILGLPEKLAAAVTAYAANAKERAKVLQGQLAGHFAKLEIEYASKSKGRGKYESFYRVKGVAPDDLQKVYSELKGLLAYLEGDDYTASKTVLEKFAATYTFFDFPSIDFGLYIRPLYPDFGVSKYFKMSFDFSLSSEMMEAHLWQFVQNAEENMGIRITVNPPSDPEDHFGDVHLEIIDQDKLDKFLASQAEEEAGPYQARETFLEMLEDIYRMGYGFYLVARSQEERKVKKDQTALLFKTLRSVGGIVFEERFGKKLVDLDTLSTQSNRRIVLLGSHEEYSLIELARLFNKVSLENEKALLETGVRELEASLAENVQDSEKEKNDRRFLQELQYKLEDIESALAAYEKNQLSFEAVKFPVLPQLPKEGTYYPVENQATPRLEASEGIRINIGEKVSIEIKFDSETQRFSLIRDGGKIHELINKNSVVIGRRQNGKIPEGVYYAVPENFEDVQNKQAEILLNPKEGTIRVINLASNEISVSGYPYMPRSEVRETPQPQFVDLHSLLPDATQIVTQIQEKRGLEVAIKTWEDQAKSRLENDIRGKLTDSVDRIISEGANKFQKAEDFMGWLFSPDFEKEIQNSLQSLVNDRTIEPIDAQALVWRIRGAVTGEAALAVEKVDLELAEQVAGVDEGKISAFQARLDQAVTVLKATYKGQKLTLAINYPDTEVVREVLIKFQDLIDRLEILLERTQSVKRSDWQGFHLGTEMLDPENPGRAVNNVNKRGFGVEPSYALTSDVLPPDLLKNINSIRAEIRKLPDPGVQRMAYGASVLLLFKLAELPKARRSELRQAEAFQSFLEQDENLSILARSFGIGQDGTIGLITRGFLADIAAIEVMERAA